MSLPLLQSTAAPALGSNPYTLAFNKPVTAASALVGLFCWGAGSVTIRTLGDNLNGPNAWTVVGSSTNTSRTVGVIFFSNTLAGALTLSMLLSGTIAQVSFSLFEFGGGAIAQDVFLPGGNATATTTPSVGPITPSQAGDLVVAAVKGTGMPTQNTPGWTPQNIANFSTEFIYPVGSPAPISASWIMGTSAPYAACIAALKVKLYALTPPGGSSLNGGNPLATTSPNAPTSGLAPAQPGSIITPGAPLSTLQSSNPFAR